VSELEKIVFDLEIPGLRSIFRPYQEAAMEVIWDSGGMWSSREVHRRVSDKLSPETISRASIINFLRKMADEGYLTFEEVTGKGGYHRLYTATTSKENFKVAMADRIVTHVRRCFGIFAIVQIGSPDTEEQEQSTPA